MRLFTLTFRLMIGAILIIILAEVTLQLLPVKTGFQRVESLDQDTPPHWKPYQEFTYSNGWRLDNPRQGNINNVGYIAPYDYTINKESIIVIGDSYIENQMNAYEDSLMGLLNKHQDLPVYAFGLSGGQLADYLGLLEYILKKYNPKHVIIKLADGDITNATNVYQPGHYYFEKSENQWRLKKSDYNHSNSLLRNFIKKSALARYFYMNLQAQRKVGKILSFNKNTSSIKNIDLKDRYRFFINKVCGASKKKGFKVTLIVNNSEFSNDEFSTLHQGCPNISTIYAKSVFEGEKRENPWLRLDFPIYDVHWNATAHRLIFEKLIKDPAFQ